MWMSETLLSVWVIGIGFMLNRTQRRQDPCVAIIWPITSHKFIAVQEKKKKGTDLCLSLQSPSHAAARSVFYCLFPHFFLHFDSSVLQVLDFRFQEAMLKGNFFKVIGVKSKSCKYSIRWWVKNLYKNLDFCHVLRPTVSSSSCSLCSHMPVHSETWRNEHWIVSNETVCLPAGLTVFGALSLPFPQKGIEGSEIINVTLIMYDKSYYDEVINIP